MYEDINELKDILFPNDNAAGEEFEDFCENMIED